MVNKNYPVPTVDGEKDLQNDPEGTQSYAPSGYLSISPSEARELLLQLQQRKWGII